MMNNKPTVHKVLQFPSGEPIIPEGAGIVNKVSLGYNGTFELPIQAVLHGHKSIDVFMEIFNQLSEYYGWEEDPDDKFFNSDKRKEEEYSAYTFLTSVNGITLPAPIRYKYTMTDDMVIDIFTSLALYYEWKRVD